MGKDQKGRPMQKTFSIAIKNLGKLFLLLFFFISAGHAKAPSRLQEAAKWAGKYPSKEIHGVELLRVYEIDRKIRHALGPKDHKRFLRFEKRSLQVPVAQYGDLLHIFLCEQHNCGHQFHFFVNLKVPDLWTCERRMDLISKGGATSAIWYSQGKKIAIVPEEFCEDFDESHEDYGLAKTLALVPPELSRRY